MNDYVIPAWLFAGSGLGFVSVSLAHTAVMSGLNSVVIVPPMTQLNTPYASLPTVAGILRSAGHQVQAWDASIDLALHIFSQAGVLDLMQAVREQGIPPAYAEVVANAERYARIIEPVIAFLQGREPGLAGRIVRQAWLPQGPRFNDGDLAIEEEAFGEHGLGDRARWLCTLMLQDLADCWRCSISPGFALTSYAAQVAMSASSFDGLADKLAQACDPIEEILLQRCAVTIATDVELIVLSVPFPGNLPAALRIAQWAKRERPQAHICMGGGYPSTELRQVSDTRVFDLVDSILLDEGEDSLPSLAQYLQDPQHPTALLQRCFLCVDKTVQFFAGSRGKTDLPTPDYTGIPLAAYIDLIDTWNPVQRLWNEGRWIKIMAARGCYWKRCSFCDTSLPYIGDFQPQRARELADRMDTLHAQTGLSCFHFTDEAAPPALMLGLALELIKRGSTYTWWGNIRFDTYFTADRCRVLAAAGMIAVTGGLETANDRLLPLIAKGVSVAQATIVGKAFAAAGILVHAYLMYGFPSETAQDCIDSVEVVRQLMQAGCIHSGFWHRFTTTAHSPIGRDPDKFGITITGPQFAGFAWNNLEHSEPANHTNHDAFGVGLADAMQHWLLGEGLDRPIGEWFIAIEPQFRAPKTKIPAQFVASILADAEQAAGDRLVWLGEAPSQHAGQLQFTDECGELHSGPADPQLYALLQQAAAGDRRGLPLSADCDVMLQGELHDLGLCRI